MAKEDVAVGGCLVGGCLLYAVYALAIIAFWGLVILALIKYVF